MTTVPVPSTSDDDSSSIKGPPSPEGAAPTSPSAVPGKPAGDASPEDDLRTAAREGTISAGETGRAVDGDGPPTRGSDVEVVIGEIPDAHDITVLHWTARCSCPEHDLLGSFDSEQEAHAAKADHLATQH